MDDRELMRLLEEDPEVGMEWLMKQHSGLLWAVVRSKLHHAYFAPADVEDCVADVLSRFYLERHAFDPARCSIRTYLSLMARRRAVDLLRRRNRAGEQVPLDAEEGGQLSAEGDSVEEAVARRDEGTRALRLIAAMGEPDRSILLGKYYYDRSSKDLARALHMKPSAVDTRAHRALKKLKQQMKGEES